MMEMRPWDDQHLGKLFERFLIDPLFKMFGNKKTTLASHKLLADCFKKEDDKTANVLQLLSGETRIHGTRPAVFCTRPIEDDVTYDSRPVNYCGKGDLLEYLNNPTEMFFMPEKSAHPDIAFVIEQKHPKYVEQFVLVPVFVQAKFSNKVDNLKKALDTIRPVNFYYDKRELAYYQPFKRVWIPNTQRRRNSDSRLSAS